MLHGRILCTRGTNLLILLHMNASFDLEVIWSPLPPICLFTNHCLPWPLCFPQHSGILICAATRCPLHPFQHQWWMMRLSVFQGIITGLLDRTCICRYPSTILNYLSITVALAYRPRYPFISLYLDIFYNP